MLQQQHPQLKALSGGKEKKSDVILQQQKWMHSVDSSENKSERIREYHHHHEVCVSFPLFLVITLLFIDKTIILVVIMTLKAQKSK